MKSKTLVSICFGLLISGVTVASDSHHHAHEQKDKAAELKLSDPVLSLLRQEMQQVKAAMQSLVGAMAMADWSNIEKLGKGIQNSFILKQRISKTQLEELHQALPTEFKKMDKKFHQYAGMLAHMAEKKDMELVQFYFSKMNESCMNCHSQFATSRFSGFKPKYQHHNHSHKP